MAKVQGKYIRKVRRKNTIKVAVVLIVFVIALVFVMMRGENTMLIERQDYTKIVDAQALFFKREVVVDFGGEITPAQQSGTKVDVYMTLAEGVSLSDYYRTERGVIDYALANGYCDGNNEVYSYVAKLYEDSKSTGAGGEEAAAELNTALRALSYVSYSSDRLTALRNTYAGDAAASSSVNLGMIPRNISGYVSYNISGFEGALSVEALNEINVDGLNFLLAYEPKAQESQTAFKIVNTACVYAAIILPTDTKADGLDNALTVRSRIVEAYGIEDDEYYSFLAERKDVIRTFECLRFEYDGTVIEGYFVEAKEVGGRLVLILGIADGIEEAVKLERIETRLYAQEYVGVCLLPKEAVYQNDFGEDCVDILAATGEKQAYVVTVLNEDEGYYICRIYARAAAASQDDEVLIDGMTLVLP